VKEYTTNKTAENHIRSEPTHHYTAQDGLSHNPFIYICMYVHMYVHHIAAE